MSSYFLKLKSSNRFWILHLSLWILSILFSLIDSVYQCYFPEILPYLFGVWLLLFIAFYFQYFIISKLIFLQRKIVLGSILSFVFWLGISYVYTQIQFTVPSGVCSKLRGIDPTSDLSHFYFYILFNSKTAYILASISVAIFYLELRYRKEMNNKKQEIKYLKEQLSPHLLLNSINSIADTAIHEPHKTVNELHDLSDWLVYSIYSIDKKSVSVYEELRHIQIYLEKIQNKIIHENKIDFKEEVPPIVSNQLKIPPLVLFNFVENAVKHSDIYSTKGAWINISIRVELNFLIFEVQNLAFQKKNQVRESMGVGLRNSRAILNRFYEKKHELIIKRENNEFHVVLKIPLS